MYLSHISKNNAQYTFQSSFMKTLDYPMIATTLTKKEWVSIITPALCATLLKMGMARNFPRQIVYGPKLFQGLGFFHPFFLQMILHTSTFIEEGAGSSQTESFFRLSWEMLLIDLGYPVMLGQTHFPAKNKRYVSIVFPPNAFPSFRHNVDGLFVDLDDRGRVPKRESDR